MPINAPFPDISLVNSPFVKSLEPSSRGIGIPFLKNFSRKGVFQGNLGRSIRTRHDVFDDIRAFLPATLELVFFTMLLAVVLGVLFGVLSAVYRDTWLDHVLRLVSIANVAFPPSGWPSCSSCSSP